MIGFPSFQNIAFSDCYNLFTVGILKRKPKSEELLALENVDVSTMFYYTYQKIICQYINTTMHIIIKYWHNFNNICIF